MAGAGNRDHRRGPAVSWPIVGAVDRKLPSSGHRRPRTEYGTYPETSSLLGFNLISTSCTGLPARILPSAGLDDSTNSRVAMLSSRWAWKQGADGLCYEDGYLHVPSDGPVSSSCAGGVHRPVCLELSAQRPQQAHEALVFLWCSMGADLDQFSPRRAIRPRVRGKHQ